MLLQARPVSVDLATAVVMAREVPRRVVSAGDVSGESVLAEEHPRAVVARVLQLPHVRLLPVALQEAPVVKLFPTAGLRAFELELFGVHRFNVTIKVIVPEMFELDKFAEIESM